MPEPQAGTARPGQTTSARASGPPTFGKRIEGWSVSLCSAAAGSAGCTPATSTAHPRARAGRGLRRGAPGRRGDGAELGAQVAGSVDEALADPGVDAVFIASSTDTHVDLITRAAKAGKAVLCEKPIDLDIAPRRGLLERDRQAEPGRHARLQPPLRPLASRRCATALQARRDRQARAGRHHQPRPGPAARRLRQGLGRPVPRHDDPRFRHGALSRRRHRRGAGDGRQPGRPGDPGRGRHRRRHDRPARGLAARWSTSTTAAAAPTATTSGSRRSARRACCRPATAARPRSRRGAPSGPRPEDPVLNFFIERYSEAYMAEIDHFVDCVEKRDEAAGRLRRGARGAAPRRRGARKSLKLRRAA